MSQLDTKRIIDTLMDDFEREVIDHIRIFKEAILRRIDNVQKKGDDIAVIAALNDEIQRVRAASAAVLNILRIKDKSLRELSEILDNPTIEALITVLKEIKDRSGVTQKEIADEIGLTQVDISKFINGKATLSKEKRERIAKWLLKRSSGSK